METKDQRMARWMAEAHMSEQEFDIYYNALLDKHVHWQLRRLFGPNWKQPSLQDKFKAWICGKLLRP